MKKILLFFFLFSGFCGFSASFSTTLDSQNSSATIGHVDSVPCSIGISITGSAIVTVPGKGSFTSSTTISVAASSSWFVGSSFLCEFRGSSGESASVTVVVVYGDTPIDPDNPGVDPENPDTPENPDDSEEDDGPYALESTLQSTNSTLNNIGSGLSNWSSWQKNTAYPEILRYIDNARSNIVQQLMNNQDTLASYLTSTNTKLDSVNTNLSAANSTLTSGLTALVDINTALGQGNYQLGTIDGKLGQANTALGDIKGQLQNGNTALGTANQALDQIRSGTSTNNQKIQDIKDFLESGDLPSQPDQLESLPASTQFVNAVKHKLLPSGSFFSPSGAQWLSWTITFPLSSFGLEDMSFTLGGSSWSTVADGSLLTLMSVIRTLSKFAFYLLFLQGVIKALRQW